jgi:hypothetical protein
MTAREDEIRRRAYSIWEEEGRIDGKHEEHWRRATEEVGQPEADHENPGGVLEQALKSGGLSSQAGMGIGGDTGPVGNAASGNPGTSHD